MNTLSNTPLTLKLLGAFGALALLAAAAVAVALTTGPAAAQTPYNIYAEPQPCGPGAEIAYQPEPHEITEGHFALFDAYWEWLVYDPGDENIGVLHTNLCPPLVVETTETNRFGQETTVTRLVDSHIDIGEAIFHVLDTHQVTVVDADQYDPVANELPADQYLELVADEHIGAGSQVWWLRLDDPNTDDVDETSDLVLGFSTMRFDDQYWGGANDSGPPFRYKFKVERNPGIDPDNHPHLFVYRAREQGADRAKLLWTTAAPDVNDLTMEAGELKDLQWVFTQPGTYQIWVHLQGWVRRDRPLDADENWSPISEYETETSEIRRYVIQVGSEFTEVEPPRFGVNRSVAENSPGGTPVGDPITVFPSEVEELEYRLQGEGSELFSLVPATDPHGVQIVVAGEARLDYEAQASYEFTLGVTDQVDHESNPDDSLDDTLAVRIALDDVTGYSASLSTSNTSPTVGEEITFAIAVEDLPAPANDFHFTWFERNHAGGGTVAESGSGRIPQSFAPVIIPEEPVVREYYITFWTWDDQYQKQNEVSSNTVTVTWGSP